MTITERIAPLQNDFCNILELFEWQLNSQSTRESIILELQHLLNESSNMDIIIQDASDDETIDRGYILLEFLDKTTKETLVLYY